MLKKLMVAWVVVAGCSQPAFAQVADCAGAVSERKYEKAVATCTQEIEERRLGGIKLIAAYLNRAIAYRGLGKIEKAVNDHKYTINIFKEIGEPEKVGMSLYYHLAWTYQKNKQYNESIEALTEGLRYQPDYCFAYYGRARGYDALGETGKARQDLEKFADIFSGALAEEKMSLDEAIKIDSWYYDMDLLHKYGIIK